MNVFKLLLTLTLSITLTSAARSDEAAKSKKKSKTPGFVTKLITDLKPIGLTEQQSESVIALGQKINSEIQRMRKDADVSPDLVKKYNEAAKAMKDSTESSEFKTASINEKAGVTAEQGEAIGRMSKLKTNYYLKIGTLLTNEQKEKLPKQVARKLSEKKKKGNGKNKDQLQETF